MTTGGQTTWRACAEGRSSAFSSLLWSHPPRLAVFARAGEAMLTVYGPYGLVVLAALGCYAALGWRNRYLASAVILGPLTWLRPTVAVAGAILGGAAGADPLAWACAGLAVAAVLAVEPLAGKLWYAPARLPRAGRRAGAAPAPAGRPGSGR